MSTGLATDSWATPGPWSIPGRYTNTLGPTLAVTRMDCRVDSSNSSGTLVPRHPTSTRGRRVDDLTPSLYPSKVRPKGSESTKISSFGTDSPRLERFP